MTSEFQKFISTGDLPASMSARSKILDIARNQILTLTQKTVSLISFTNKSGKLKLSEAIQKTSVDALLQELGKVFGAKAAALGNTFGGLTNHAQNAADTLDIEIHSPGGSVLDGYRVYHAIKELRGRGVHVTATINTLAASMASVIAMACDKIIMVQGGRMMIHEVSSSVSGDAAALAKQAKLCEDMSNEIATIYSNRTKKPVKAMRDLMKLETWMGADEALKSGFIDSISNTNQTMNNVISSPTAQAIAAAIIGEQERRTSSAKIKTSAEFRAMPPREQGPWIRTPGNRIVDPPAAAKPHKAADGRLTMAGFNSLSPTARLAHLKAGNTLAD